MRKIEFDRTRSLHLGQMWQLEKNVLALMVGMSFFVVCHMQTTVSSEKLGHVHVPSERPRIHSDREFELGTAHRCIKRMPETHNSYVPTQVPVSRLEHHNICMCAGQSMIL